jgi:hypothetical protein
MQSPEPKDGYPVESIGPVTFRRNEDGTYDAERPVSVPPHAGMERGNMEGLIDAMQSVCVLGVSAARGYQGAPCTLLPVTLTIRGLTEEQVHSQNTLDDLERSHDAVLAMLEKTLRPARRVSN